MSEVKSRIVFFLKQDVDQLNYNINIYRQPERIKPI